VNAEIDEKQGEQVVEEANRLGGQAVLVKTDVTSWDSVQEMVKATLARFGRIDVLVNNVGRTWLRPFVEKSTEECEKEISLNYRSVINSIKAASPHMMEHKYGKIISIASVSGQWGYAAYNGAVYGGTKAGVIALSKALAWELGSHNINVNVVCPGWIIPDRPEDVGEGSWWTEWGFDAFTTDPGSSDVLQKGMRYWPIRRMGKPEDIADTVLFLASERASFLTGQSISVSGGMTMW
jgi:2-hydroxycyclohexanecarboxyl-CoA dehydrogenase